MAVHVNLECASLGSIMANRELLCAVAAYSGHNWELYGMWSSYHAFALRSVSAGGEDGGASTASAIAFGVIGCGCVSSILAGVLADRVGRTTICLVSCTVSALVSMCLGGMHHCSTRWENLGRFCWVGNLVF